MSVFWKTDHYGYDGDFMHGRVKVNYWQTRDEIEAELDQQIAEFRASMLLDYGRLTGQDGS